MQGTSKRDGVKPTPEEVRGAAVNFLSAALIAEENELSLNEDAQTLLLLRRLINRERIVSWPEMVKFQTVKRGVITEQISIHSVRRLYKKGLLEIIPDQKNLQLRLVANV